MWYLILGLAFVSVGVGLAIWVAREKAAKLEKERDRYGEIAKQNEEACARLEEEIGRYQELVEVYKSRLTAAREKLLETADVSDVRDILNDTMGEETI
jgi:prefoldin subunit 5